MLNNIYCILTLFQICFTQYTTKGNVMDVDIKKCCKLVEKPHSLIDCGYFLYYVKYKFIELPSKDTINITFTCPKETLGDSFFIQNMEYSFKLRKKKTSKIEYDFISIYY